MGQDQVSHPTLPALHTVRSGAYHTILGHWYPQGDSSQSSTLHLPEPVHLQSRPGAWSEQFQACHHSSQPWHSPIHFHVSSEWCRSSGDATIPLHLCCWLSDVSCSHHKARHCLCCRSPCQIQLQPWQSRKVKEKLKKSQKNWLFLDFSWLKSVFFGCNWLSFLQRVMSQVLITFILANFYCSAWSKPQNKPFQEALEQRPHLRSERCHPWMGLYSSFFWLSFVLTYLVVCATVWRPVLVVVATLD